MTEFEGEPAAHQVIRRADLLRRQLGRADGPYDPASRPTTAQVRRLTTTLKNEFADLLRTEQRRANRAAYVRGAVLVDIDQGELARVARIHPSNLEREGLLLGGVMNADREVAKKLLTLIDQRYLLNPDSARTWLGARKAYDAGDMLRPPVLGAVPGGVSEDILNDLREKYLRLDVDTLLDNARIAAGVGLHRHAITAAGKLAARAKDPDEPTLDMLRWSIDSVSTVATMAERIEKAVLAFELRAAAGTAQPVHAAIRAMHNKTQAQPAGAQASGDQPAQGEPGIGGPVQRPGATDRRTPGKKA